MKKTTAQIVRDELKKARLDTVAKDVGVIKDAARIIRENEQNLKDLGNLKGRLDLLDKIYVSVDKIAGEVTTYRQQQELNSGKLANHDDRLGKVEKHLHFSITP
ncbi:MAG: hypothetical protein NT149_02485 [Candidatus Gottesmanbacteria bacterium]|nr:hypothetical protein [Candidatus Gottesmanbacteria bacterium]